MLHSDAKYCTVENPVWRKWDARLNLRLARLHPYRQLFIGHKLYICTYVFKDICGCLPGNMHPNVVWLSDSGRLKVNFILRSSYISTGHITSSHQQHYRFRLEVQTVLYPSCLPFHLVCFVCVLKPRCNKSEAFDCCSAERRRWWWESTLDLWFLRRQRSRYTLLIQSILCRRGVAKQPQGTEWDSNRGDLELQWAYHWCDRRFHCLHDIIL